MRQCVAAIQERRSHRRWEREQWLLWQTRTLATFIAATVPVEKGQPHTLLDHAQNVGQPVDAAEGGNVPARGEPRTGSYEAFMHSFGSPRRWAGAGG